MNVLTVIFGGIDGEFLVEVVMPEPQVEWGPVVVDELTTSGMWRVRSLLNSSPARPGGENGVGDRKKQLIRYRQPLVRWIEERLLANVSKGQPKRRGIYQTFRWADVTEREYLKEDLTCPSIFDRAPGSQAVYVPAY